MGYSSRCHLRLGVRDEEIVFFRLLKMTKRDLNYQETLALLTFVLTVPHM